MNKENKSRPLVFPNVTLLFHKEYGVGELVNEFNADFIDSDHYIAMVGVKFFKNRLLEVRADTLRTLTFKEFLLHRLSNGEWMHGNWTWHASAIRYAGLLLFSVYGFFHWNDPINTGWLRGVAIAPLLIIGLILLGMWRNYRGKQM